VSSVQPLRRATRGGAEGPDFTGYVDAAVKVRAEEAWLACATCLSLVEGNDRDGLVERGIQGHRRRHGTDLHSKHLERMVRTGQERFWGGPRSR
jgi:hypothetical protein